RHLRRLVALSTFLTGWRISIEESKRYSRHHDNTAEGDERPAPAQRDDEPGVDRVEGNGAGRIAGAEDAHRRPARLHEPARHERRRRNDHAGDPRGAEDTEAHVVLRERS